MQYKLLAHATVDNVFNGVVSRGGIYLLRLSDPRPKATARHVTITGASGGTNFIPIVSRSGSLVLPNTSGSLISSRRIVDFGLIAGSFDWTNIAVELRIPLVSGDEIEIEGFGTARLYLEDCSSESLDCHDVRHIPMVSLEDDDSGLGVLSSDINGSAFYSLSGHDTRVTSTLRRFEIRDSHADPYVVTLSGNTLLDGWNYFLSIDSGRPVWYMNFLIWLEAGSNIRTVGIDNSLLRRIN
jgi:hypothetical protein